MAVPPYTVRTLSKCEAGKALALWKETGFHEGAHAIETFHEVDPEGFWVAVTEEDIGDIIGLCSSIILHENLAFLGIYVVKEKYRGQGIGMEVWKACYRHIGTRNAALNAVPGKLELYRDRGGFPVVETEWVTHYCEADHVDPAVLLKEVPDVLLKPITDDDLPLVLDYDRELIGFQRHKTISLTIKEEDSTSYLAVKDGKCVGYGVHKISCQGHGLVGPLYADNQDVAEAILRRLIETLPQAKGFAIMAISTNRFAKSITSKLGMGFIECPRAYKRFKLKVDIDKVYGHLNMNFSPF